MYLSNPLERAVTGTGTHATGCLPTAVMLVGWHDILTKPRS